MTLFWDLLRHRPSRPLWAGLPWVLMLLLRILIKRYRRFPTSKGDTFRMLVLFDQHPVTQGY